MIVPSLTHKKDYELVQKVLSGDNKSYNILYNNSYLYVYNYINKIIYKDMLTYQEIQDIAHDVLLKCFSKLQTYNGNCLFTTWLCAYAKYTVWNLNKKILVRNRKKIHYSKSTKNPNIIVVIKERTHATFTALNSLCYLDYYLLTRHILGELPFYKISEELKIPIKKIHIQYEIAVNNFIKKFKSIYGCLPNEDPYFWNY